MESIWRRTDSPEFLLSILWIPYGPKTHSERGYRLGTETLTARVHDGSFLSSPRRYAFGPSQMITRRDVAESENGLASRDSICDALPDLDDGKQDGAAKMMRSFSDSWKILLPRPLTLALLNVML